MAPGSSSLTAFWAALASSVVSSQSLRQWSRAPLRVLVGAALLHQPADVELEQVAVAVDGQAHAEAELGVVLEEGVRPSRALAVLASAIGDGREGAAVDGGAAGGVGDDHALAVESGRPA